MEEYGMTDKQFNGFLRLLLLNLESVQNAESKEDMLNKLDEIIKMLQISIED